MPTTSSSRLLSRHICRRYDVSPLPPLLPAPGSPPASAGTEHAPTGRHGHGASFTTSMLYWNQFCTDSGCVPQIDSTSRYGCARCRTISSVLSATYDLAACQHTGPHAMSNAPPAASYALPPTSSTAASSALCSSGSSVSFVCAAICAPSSLKNSMLKYTAIAIASAVFSSL